MPLTTPEMDALYELPFTRVPHPRHQGDEAPGVRDDQVLGDDPARLLRRLQLLLDHRARGPRDPEPLGGVDPARDRAHPRSDAGLHRHHQRPRRPDGEHVPAWRARAARSRPRAASRRACSPTSATTSAPITGRSSRCTARRARSRASSAIFIASGVRYDLAVRSPEWIRELAQHHTGGYLKIAPEHTEDGPLRHMMKPGIGAYDRFKELFDRYSQEAGKEQYLIPYFIAAHPGTTDEDMLNLALWLKRNGFRPDQVQAFLPSPMASATAMYHTGLQPAALAQGARARARREGARAAPAPQGVPALPRSEQLADAARGAAPHGPRRSDRRRQAPARAVVAARRHRRRSARAARGRIQPGVALTQHTGLPPRPRAGTRSDASADDASSSAGAASARGRSARTDPAHTGPFCR